MYESFYNFKEKPFAVTPDPTFLFLGSKKHSTCLSLLQYGLVNRAAIIVLTGVIGAGKTTLIRQLLNEVGNDNVVGMISNTHESFGNLMQWIAVAFDLPARTGSKAILYDRFARFLVEQYAKGKQTILIVDEAQNLSERTLEELRLLSNINADKHQILQLILVGQPELRARLRQPNLVQFVQRIGVDFHLSELSIEETMNYIDYRLTQAGGKAGILEPAAKRFIHHQCGGVPRLINAVCDTALVYGFAEQRQTIEARLVHEMVCERIRTGLFAALGSIDPTADIFMALESADRNLALAQSEFAREFRRTSELYETVAESLSVEGQ